VVGRDDTPTPPVLLGGANLIAGRYRLDHELGSGGMGEVFAATDLILHRRVAVKRLHGIATADSPETARLYREAQALARVNDPRVVAVFDVPEQDGHPCIVMELIEAPTLRSVLHDEGSLPPSRAVGIAVGVAGGLAAAHANGVVHRDVKPSNIFVTPSGQVKLADFGIARLASAATLTSAGEVLGSPTYLAPERVQAGGADPRSDLYSLGCVLFQMLVGRPPFEGDDVMGVTYQHLHAPPERVDELDPTVPPALGALVDRLLAKDPADRPSTADDLARELRAIDLDPPREAATGVVPGRVARASRGRSMAWIEWATAAALVIAVIAGAVLLIGADPAPAPAGGSSPAANGVLSTSTAPTSPTATTSSSTSSTEGVAPPTTAEGAAAALAGLVDGAVAGGLVDERAADKIQDRIDKVVEELVRGHPDHALDRLSDVTKEVEHALDHGEISEQAAADIQDAVVDLEAAILAG
jgi:serine/threonine-protein kinase